MQAKLVINSDLGGPAINPNIYGHFAEHLGHCIYGGIWVGEDSDIPNTRGIRNDVVKALKGIDIPVLRWPGGCFADEYHWEDGIGPYGSRPTMVNTHWGGVTENNHFGTHEFMDLCEQLGCAPYICGNVGSGTIREMQQWVEYITFDGLSPMADLRRANGREAPWALPYWGVGNENWGCGGHMTPEYYANEYRRYQTYVRHLSGNRVYKVACGASSFDYRWTEVLMREAARFMDGLSLHYYTRLGHAPNRGSATEFDESEWFGILHKALEIETLIVRHATIMDRYDPEKRVGMIVDEWGTWYEVEPGTPPGFLYQQNSLRDALVAGLSLNIMNNHCDRVRMANIAQTVNVLQAMVLTDGPRMILTPTYHVYEMFKVHQGATRLPVDLTTPDYAYKESAIPAVSASASRNIAGTIHLSLCNLDPNQSVEVQYGVRGSTVDKVSGRMLTATAINSHNTFDRPDKVTPAPFDGLSFTAESLSVTLPPRSVVVLSIENA